MNLPNLNRKDFKDGLPKAKLRATLQECMKDVCTIGEDPQEALQALHRYMDMLVRMKHLLEEHEAVLACLEICRSAADAINTPQTTVVGSKEADAASDD